MSTSSDQVNLTAGTNTCVPLLPCRIDDTASPDVLVSAIGEVSIPIPA